MTCGAPPSLTWTPAYAGAQEDRQPHASSRAGLPIALAGSLGREEIRRLLPLGPDLIAVRGAACRDRDRNGAIERHAVAELVELLQETNAAESRGLR